MNKQLDQILEFLEEEDWYVDFTTICDKFKIPDPKRNYVLNKLDTDGYIDVLRTKTTLEIKISDEGRIFIHESSYREEAEDNKRFESEIKRSSRFETFFKIATLILTVVATFFAYMTFQKDVVIEKQSEKIETLENQLSEVDKSVKEMRFFSDPESKDTFRLHMKGKDILTSDIKFEIMTSTGENIFTHDFKAVDLIGYGLVSIETPTVEQKENYILKRFYNFLDESNFMSPAIASDEVLDTEYFDIEYFEEIKNQPESISFYYLLGEEYMRRITFLRKIGKVVEFWSCC